MKQINVRLPDDSHKKLVALAERERRSLNNMLIALIERAARLDRPDSPEPLTGAVSNKHRSP